MIGETVEEIRGIQTHNSSVVAVRTTRALAKLIEYDYTIVEKFEHDLERSVGVLRQVNSSHASLYNALQDVFHSAQDEVDDLDEARELTLSTIDRMAEIVETGKRHVAQQAVTTVEDDRTFLTHSYSSMAMETVELTVVDGAQLTAYVTEVRPRPLSWKFAYGPTAIDNVEPHLVVNGTSGMFLPGCDHVIIGMDCVVRETLYNRIGAFPLVAAASKVGMSVMVVGSGVKIVDGGFHFGNEARSPNEVMLESVEGIELENLAYDAMSVDLIDEVITGEGVIKF